MAETRTQAAGKMVAQHPTQAWFHRMGAAPQTLELLARTLGAPTSTQVRRRMVVWPLLMLVGRMLALRMEEVGRQTLEVRPLRAMAPP